MVYLTPFALLAICLALSGITSAHGERDMSKKAALEGLERALKTGLSTRETEPTRAETGSKRIIGGVRETSAFPWVVRIPKIGGDSRQLCSGILINNEWVATSAHCMIEGDPPTGFITADPPLSTLINIGCADAASPSCIAVGAAEIHVHPCYVIGLTDHDDIALIRLDRSLNYQRTAFAPIDNLNGTANLNLEAEDAVTLAGFGVLDNDDRFGADGLFAVNVTVRTPAECRAANPFAVANNLIDFDQIICTGGEAGKDSCGGDSGGPVIKITNGRPYVVGLLVKGSEKPYDAAGACAIEGRYGMYSRLQAYTDFIYQTIQGQTYTCDTCPCYASPTLYQTNLAAFPPAPIITVNGAGATRPSLLLAALGMALALVAAR